MDILIYRRQQTKTSVMLIEVICALSCCSSVQKRRHLRRSLLKILRKEYLGSAAGALRTSRAQSKRTRISGRRQEMSLVLVLTFEQSKKKGRRQVSWVLCRLCRALLRPTLHFSSTSSMMSEIRANRAMPLRPKTSSRAVVHLMLLLRLYVMRVPRMRRNLQLLRSATL